LKNRKNKEVDIVLLLLRDGEDTFYKLNSTGDLLMFLLDNENQTHDAIDVHSYSDTY